MTSRRTVLVFAAVLVIFGIVGAAAAVAGGGNSANAKLCQKNGWQSVETDTGGHFADAEACTSFAASGGTLFNPTLIPVFEGCLGFGFGGQVTYYAEYVFNLSGFHPDSVVTFRPPGSPYPYPGFTITTDAVGSGTTAPTLVVEQPGWPGGLEATDAQGVDGLVEFTAATC
jgi:hypothetical protein